jgi:hypothetical protein
MLSTTATKNHVFLGGADNPLLAPRGVHLAQGKLIVADTGQNRVFIWNSIPATAQQEPEVVLGQAAVTDTERNAGGKVGASSLMYPSGLWSDGQRLIVADAWNHRVLIWNAMPTEHGQPADVVIGQPNFTGNEPNVSGIGSDPAANSLNWPYGLTSDGERLFIADTGNRRVLVFNQIPTNNFAAADGVIGKRDFRDRDYDHHNAIWPYSVKLGPNGEMAITDTQYYRVLLWRHWEEALHQPSGSSSAKGPDTIIGQPDINANGQNQFRWYPENYTLNWCYDSCFHQDGLLVADTGNSRVLHFQELPTKNNFPADHLLGQANFNVGIENRNSITATPESMYWPFHLDIEGGLMAIADTGNHRIILHALHF